MLAGEVGTKFVFDPPQIDAQVRIHDGINEGDYCALIVEICRRHFAREVDHQLGILGDQNLTHAMLTSGIIVRMGLPKTPLHLKMPRARLTGNVGLG